MPGIMSEGSAGGSGLQVWSTLKKPISAPRWPGLRATSSRVSALAAKQQIIDELSCSEGPAEPVACGRVKTTWTVGYGQQFTTTRGDPAFARTGLTLRDSAGCGTVVGDGG